MSDSSCDCISYKHIHRICLDELLKPPSSGLDPLDQMVHRADAILDRMSRRERILAQMPSQGDHDKVACWAKAKDAWSLYRMNVGWLQKTIRDEQREREDFWEKHEATLSAEIAGWAERELTWKAKEAAWEKERAELQAAMASRPVGLEQQLQAEKERVKRRDKTIARIQGELIKATAEVNERDKYEKQMLENALALSPEPWKDETGKQVNMVLEGLKDPDLAYRRAISGYQERSRVIEKRLNTRIKEVEAQAKDWQKRYDSNCDAHTQACADIDYWSDFSLFVQKQYDESLKKLEQAEAVKLEYGRTQRKLGGVDAENLRMEVQHLTKELKLATDAVGAMRASSHTTEAKLQVCQDLIDSQHRYFAHVVDPEGGAGVMVKPEPGVKGEMSSVRQEIKRQLEEAIAAAEPKKRRYGLRRGMTMKDVM